MADKETRLSISIMSSWALRKAFYLLLTLFGIFLVIAFFSYTEGDSFYGFQNSEPAGNITGYYGGYIAGTILNYFDIAGTLIPAWCLIWGVKMLIGIRINYVIFRFVSLIASVLWLSAISIKFAFFQNILGNQINLFLEFYLYNNFNSEFFEIFFKSLSVLIFIPVVLFSLSIKNKPL